MTSLIEKMMIIRLVEERLQKLCDQGEAGDLHFNKGQEAISVGVCAALRSTDHIVTHHRTIAHQIAKGADLRPLIAEMLGKSTGTNSGRAGEMHISDRNIRHDFAFQLVGTCIPVAAGIAWGLKNYQRNDEIVACFFGDATTSSGQFHEGLSLAAIHQLPVLYICENNNRAGNIEPEHYLPNPNLDLSSRADGYDIPTDTVDGNKLSDVMDRAEMAIQYVRENKSPFMLVCDTTRLCWHKQGQRDIRTPEQLAKEAERDPLRDLQIPQELVSMVNAVFEQVARDPIASPYPDGI